ncbi:MAG: phosphoribosyltransferase family protein [Clostridia bacterium]
MVNVDKSYKMNIAGLDRELPLCPINENLYIGAFIMFGDVEITKASAKALLEKAPDFDIMLTAECKSIPLIYEMARQINADNYIIARKGPKLYMKNIITTDVDSITTAHKQTLCIGQDELDALKGKKILIVDDVISTGESLLALTELAEKAGGIVVGKAAVLAEGKAAERDDIIFLEKLPLFDKDGNPIG